tara:strand:- start:1803 stop:2024 length:222 start_codon:yes stop_codon:yes gene_type:complete
MSIPSSHKKVPMERQPLTQTVITDELNRIKQEVNEMVMRNSPHPGWTKARIESEIARRLNRWINHRLAGSQLY